MTQQTQRDRCIIMQRDLQKYKRKRGRLAIDYNLLRMTCAHLDKILGRPGRIAFLSWAFEREITSSHDMTPEEAMGLLTWAKPTKRGVGDWVYNPDLRSLLDDWTIIVQGQLPLPDQLQDLADHG